MTDPSALDAEEGPAGRLTVTAPVSWRQRRVALSAPRVLTCAACEGGGCDACDRRGAVEASVDPAERRIELQVPPLGPTPVAVRLPRPFGPASTIVQLLLVWEAGPPDPRLQLLGSAPQVRESRGLATSWSWVALALAGALVLALARWAAG